MVGIQITYFNNFPTNKVLAPTTSDYYNECVIDAYLKRTGSDGDFIITASLFSEGGGYSGSIYSGSTFTFTDSPWNGIEFDQDFSVTTQSTYTNPGDMYYVEYEFKDFKSGQIGGIIQLNQNVAFKSDNHFPKIAITSSGPGGSSDFDFTETSVRIRKSNINPPQTSPGEIVWDEDFTVQNLVYPSNTVTLIAPYNGIFSANDIHRFSVYVNKTGANGSQLLIEEFSASIFPSQLTFFTNYQTPFSPAFSNYRLSQKILIL